MSFSTHRTIPPPPQKQGEKSATFRPPPIDGSFTLQQMYYWHLANSAAHRIFVYAREDGSTRTICWPEEIAAIYTGARLMKQRISTRHKPPVVAILLMSDTITYFTTMMSLLHANFILFPISPRNSALAVAHLLHKVGVEHVLVGRDKYRFIFARGSTAYPRPIPWTSHRVVQLCLIPWFGERDLCDVVFSLHVMPMYHGMGVLQLCWMASSGLVVSAFEPKSPALPPTPDNLFVSARAAQSDVIFCVPSFIEAWSRCPEYVEWLATRSGVLFGGGPLNKEAGDYLTSKGVSIFILYGSTEGGIMSHILPAQVGYDWDYFKFPGLVVPEMVTSGSNSYELVMVANKYCQPSVVNTAVDGTNAYATSDLFIPHPTKVGFWKIFGRTDDQIMHNTGEKVTAVHLNILNQDPHVSASVFFGRGMFQAGVLVEPKAQFAFDLEDESKLAEFRNKIWPTVERMNKFAPQHSRLFKEMILVAKPRKPFTYTAKNTARRQAILDDYSEEILAVYKTVEEGTQASIPPPLDWDDISTKEFVRTVVSQATWIRNTLFRALRDTAKIDTRQTTDNSYIHTQVDKMHAMVLKYSNDLPVMSVKHTDRMILKTGKVVLLTGTTGSLGCHILASLVLDQAVQRIYAVNRPGKISAKGRQQQSLINHGLNIDMEKVTMLKVDLIFPIQITNSVTHIIHNAWRVDFNLGLSSFESNIRGLRSLIELALASQARLVFTSSIGVFQHAGEDHPLAETHIDADIAQETGYSESKWVSEELLRLVPGLRYLIVRVGQLTGGLKGVWNPKEWVPSMIQSSTVLGCLPNDEQVCALHPVPYFLCS
ncbi:hypothetical protein IW261DRAFT_1547429 [Armillaria novae-zelandiae]|uniref:Acetyl-CoA synthetase-like protein n=1 Tax=Armillaria novae-zelandiae TaxID=153914 RepID=A0AA39TJ14_9AGAR|nr:hypothetical protein IW261DRAFT_1547429 [Armillaria novae-zelandiae]